MPHHAARFLPACSSRHRFAIENLEFYRAVEAFRKAALGSVAAQGGRASLIAARMAVAAEAGGDAVAVAGAGGAGAGVDALAHVAGTLAPLSKEELKKRAKLMVDT